MNRLRVLLLALFLPACGQPPGATPVHGGGPQTPAEKIVADRILEVQKGREVTWLEWGPNDTAGLTHYKDPARYQTVRIRYRMRLPESPPYVDDALYVVDMQKGKVDTAGINISGAGWLDKSRRGKEKAEQRAR
jgi:hypothetical protein